MFTLVGGRTEEAGNGDAEETGADRTVAGGAEKEAGTDPDQHRSRQQEVVTGGWGRWRRGGGAGEDGGERQWSGSTGCLHAGMYSLLKFGGVGG